MNSLGVRVPTKSLKTPLVVVWGAGLIGRAIVRELAPKFQVIVVDINPEVSKYLSDDIKVFLPDEILQTNLLSSTSALVWSAGVLSPMIDKELSITATVEQEFYDLLSKGQFRKNLHLLLISSLAVYEEPRGASERSPLKSKTAYGAHKIRIEAIASEWKRLKNGKMTIIRSCGVVGSLFEEGGGWMHTILYNFVRNKKKYLNMFDRTRGQEIMHCHDLAVAVRKAIEMVDSSSQVYNIGSGVVIPPVSKSRASAGLDWSKARTMLGYQPKFTNFSQIMEDIMSSAASQYPTRTETQGQKHFRIMILSGSHRAGWYTTALADEVARQLRTKDVEIDFVEVSTADLPMHNPDDHKDPKASDDPRVRSFARRAEKADGYVWLSPIYHGSYSSGLKRIIDHLNISLIHEKPVGIMVHGGGRFSGSAIEHLRTVGFNLHAAVVNTAVATNVSDFSETDTGKVLTNPDIQHRISHLIDQLIERC